ncbi:MAG: radical SAM protein, partial [Acidilobaceae archaeon]
LKLWDVGLDEIRFHPVAPRAFELAEFAAKETGMSVGFEIPIAPGLEEWAKSVVREASKIGAKFVNLNEMEVSEKNLKKLFMRGLRPSRSRPYAVEGALKAALEVMKWAKDNVSLAVHFCPVSFKDSVQLKNRMRRTAKNDFKWFEEPTEDGTVLWGELECKEPLAGVGEECRKNRTCIPPNEELLKKLARENDCKAFLIEAYPTRSRTILREEEF